MLKAGDHHQAIQLAEAQPNLLDCVTALEFRDADRWRAYCQQHGLPVADKIDARSVHALNECYAQGIPTDHPLYAAYRKAALSRDDEEALKTLQSIVRLNPSDKSSTTKEPILVTVADSGVTIERFDHPDQRRQLDRSGADSAFESYLRKANALDQYMVFLVRPSGIALFQDLLKSARGRGFDVGFDALEESRRIHYFYPSAG